MNVQIQLEPQAALRRRLILAGSAIAGAPLALIGCGGGGGEGSDAGAGAGSGDPVLDAPPGPVKASAQSVAVELPAGVRVAPGAMQLVGITGAAPVERDAATIELLEGGPQLVSVVAADGTPLLMGWAGAGRAPISARTTAAVLLHFGLGVAQLGPDVRDHLRERLDSHPALDRFGLRIAAALAADASALLQISPAILEGFAEAAQALLPAAAAGFARAQGVVIEPAAERSGVSVVHAEQPNTFVVENRYLRRGVILVNREAWVDASGTRHAEPQAPVPVGEPIELPRPAAIDSVGNVIGGWANEYYSGDSQGTFFRSVSEPITLELTPEAAKRTEYKVVVLLAGATPGQTAEFERLGAAHQVYLRGVSLKNLDIQTLLLDFLVPMMFGFLAEKLGEAGAGKGRSEVRKELVEAFAGTALTILQNQVPALIEQLAAQQIDAWGAFKSIVKSLTIDPGTFEMSPLLRALLEALAQFLARQLAERRLRSRMLEVVGGIRIGGKGVLGFIPALRVLDKADEVLARLAEARIVADVLRSARVQAWELRVTKAKVVLGMSPREVTDLTGVYLVTPEIVDNDDDEYGVEKGAVTFDWVCSAHWGDLVSSADRSRRNRFTASRDFARCTYEPRGIEPEPAQLETIEVAAYFEDLTSRRRSLIGKASLTVPFRKAFSLQIAPASAELPTDATLGVLATLNEALPAGATVDWSFTQSGVGSASAMPPDGNPRDAAATFASGSVEGEARVSAGATVTLPGTPARRVICEPVTAVIAVRRGLRTLKVKGSFALDFFDIDPGRLMMVAYFVVPAVDQARTYDVSADGFNDTAFWGTRWSTHFAHDTGLPGRGTLLSLQYRGSSFWSPLSSFAGPADKVIEQIGWMSSRFTGANVVATVTLV